MIKLIKAMVTKPEGTYQKILLTQMSRTHDRDYISFTDENEGRKTEIPVSEIQRLFCEYYGGQNG